MTLSPNIVTFDILELDWALTCEFWAFQDLIYYHFYIELNFVLSVWDLSLSPSLEQGQSCRLCLTKSQTQCSFEVMVPICLPFPFISTKLAIGILFPVAASTNVILACWSEMLKGILATAETRPQWSFSGGLLSWRQKQHFCIQPEEFQGQGMLQGWKSECSHWSPEATRFSNERMLNPQRQHSVSKWALEGCRAMLGPYSLLS